jgi:hypothetical protein
MLSGVGERRRAFSTSSWARMVRAAAHSVGTPWCRIAAVLVVMLSSIVWLLRNHVNGDVAWYLYAGTRLAEGGVLYRDVGDMNPPLMYLAQIPFVLVSRITSIPVHVVFFVGLMLGLCGVLLLSSRLLTALGAFSRLWRDTILLFTAFDFGITNRRDVGQRDHIVAYAFLPFVLTAASRLAGTLPSEAYALCIAALAGLAIALKPYFLLPWAAVLAYVAWKRGAFATIRTPECWMVLLVNGSYWLSIQLFFPTYFQLSLQALKYYSAMNASLGGIAQNFLPYSVLLIVPFLKCGKSMRPLLMLGMVASLGFMLDALVQHKGWSYHLVPALYFSRLTILLAVANFMQTPRAYRNTLYLKPAMIASLICGLMVLGALVTSSRVGRNDLPEREVETLVPFLQQHANGKPVLVLTTGAFAFPLVYEAGVRLSLPEPQLWTLPGLYYDQIRAANTTTGYVPARYHQEAERNADEKALFAEMRGAILEARPAVIVVEDKTPEPWMGRLDFSFLQYLSTDTELRDELLHYRQEIQTPRCHVLVRID